MLKLKSLISILTLVGLIMTSCGKETIYIEKEPDGRGYENLDPTVRALIDALGNRAFASYIDDVLYEPDTRIIPAGGSAPKMTITGNRGPWDLRAMEIYPTEGDSEIELADAVSSNNQTTVIFPANPKNDIVVWELQIKPHDDTEWSYFGFYVQLCNNEIAYEIQDVENNIVSADAESINIRLTKQNVMESEDDVLWFTVYEEGSSESIDSQPYNLAMMSVGAYTTLRININENSNDIRTLQIYYHLNSSSEKYNLGTVIQRPGAYVPEVPEAEVTDVLPLDRYYIDPLGGAFRMQLVGEFYEETEISVRVVPYLHPGYPDSFTPIAATASKDNNWEFVVEFPPARGAQYPANDPNSGWHVNFAEYLMKGIYGAGMWSVECKNSSGEWVSIGDFTQEAYYLGVRNKQASLRRGGGEWKLEVRGHWPIGTVKFQVVCGDLKTGEVTVNCTTELYKDSWIDGATFVIPENNTGDLRVWQLQYWIDEIGDWRTWDIFGKPGEAEYGWEGISNQLVQYHF